MCGDDVFDFGQIRREIDAVLTFGRGEAHVDHPLQERLHIIVETVEVIEDARLGQLIQADLRHHFADFLQCARAAGKAMNTSPSSIMRVRRSVMSGTMTSSVSP